MEPVLLRLSLVDPIANMMNSLLVAYVMYNNHGYFLIFESFTLYNGVFIVLKNKINVGILLKKNIRDLEINVML